ncbi:hypothetical protein GX888_03580 [Candidatus Dojkabacteria bacterium]|uniref:Uncharacterized protein n=1 Tax=Candidatus Dojkabacteria bacterium TaxID=2099670 RepID=A0A847VE37_9BACT|nr:hypothetical protein [Candidatus Dojkabacteria bacterium]
MLQENILTSSEDQRVLGDTKIDSTVAIILFLLKDFFIWWYIKITLWHLKVLGRLITVVDDNLSLSILMKNFFLPWRRDRIFIGYIFGIGIKIIYLPIAIIILTLITLFYTTVIILWLALPISTVLFLFYSIWGILWQ